MKSSRQLFLDKSFKQKLVHGGELGFGKRKVARPLSTKKAMYATLRSSVAVGKYSLRVPRHRVFIEKLFATTAKKWGIRIYNVSINGNHLHFVLKGDTRRGIQNFLRILSAQIATFVTGARKGKPFGRFWDAPAWTRILEWGQDFKRAIGYVTQNVLETLGIIRYIPRSEKKRLKILNPKENNRPTGRSRPPQSEHASRAPTAR